MLVAGLHALLLLGAWRLQAWQDRGPPAPAQAPLIVWLQGAPRPSMAPTAALRPTRPAAPQRTPPLANGAIRAGPATPAAAQAITLPSTPVEPTADAPGPAASAPLNLALPRGPAATWRGPGGVRNPALDDPRSNSARPTLESRIAAALGGSDQVTEYRLEDGSVRLKRGSRCVVVRPNRAGTLDPFNGSAQIRPRLLDSC